MRRCWMVLVVAAALTMAAGCSMWEGKHGHDRGCKCGKECKCGMQRGGPGMMPGGPGMHRGGMGMWHRGPGMERGGMGMWHRGPGMMPGGPGMWRGGPAPMQAFGEKLGLTDEQQKKMAEIRKGAFEKMKTADTPEKRQEILKQMGEDTNKVLTPEQLKKLEEARKAAPGPGMMPGGPGMHRGGMGIWRGAMQAFGEKLGLTEEQQKKIAEIRKGAFEKMKTADTPEKRQEIFKQMHEDINKVLAPEQLKKAEEPAKAPVPAPPQGQ